MYVFPDTRPFSFYERRVDSEYPWTENPRGHRPRRASADYRRGKLGCSRRRLECGGDTSKVLCLPETETLVKVNLHISG